MNEPVVMAAIILVVAVGGLALGFFARGYVATQAIKAANEKSERIVAEARAQQKDLILQAKEEQVKIQREVDEEGRAKRVDLQKLERRLLDRDEQLDQRTDMLEGRDRNLLIREQELDKQRAELSMVKAEQVQALERVSGLSADEAKSTLVEAVREEAEKDSVRLVRSIERSAREGAEDKARDVVITAIQRVMVDHTAGATVTTVAIPSDEMKGRIIGREGRNIRALEQATGVDLIIDDTPDSVMLSGFDPVRREVARLALTKLVQDGRIHPGRIEDVVRKAQAEVDVVIREAGEAAAYDSGVPGLPQEILTLLGRLRYRTSFGQSVLNHVKETSHLAGIIAAELGADVQVAKLGGLLHDMGKAIDHDSPKAINAIAAHHREVEYTCQEAPIVQIADAISASRPGARGESMDTYVKRLTDLQEIADGFPGVEKSFAVQAGREVRILVRPDEIDDLASGRLARDIVRQIEESLNYPGQIKVTVIRETRSVEYAK